MTTRARPADETEEFMAQMRACMAHQLAIPGATKRSAVRLALVDLIRQGQLHADDLLPGETALAEGLKVSLGTVQAALGQLQDMGIVQRRRGDGTRITESAVSGERNPVMLHFRFRDLATGRPVHPAEQDIEVLETGERGAWSDHLGGAARYTLIRRLGIGDGDARLGAEMYLSAAKVPAARLTLADLRATNIRGVLETMLGVKTRRVDHVAHVEILPDALAALFSLPRGAPALVLEARTYLDHDAPFYYQRIFAPADRVALEF